MSVQCAFPLAGGSREQSRLWHGLIKKNPCNDGYLVGSKQTGGENATVKRLPAKFLRDKMLTGLTHPNYSLFLHRDTPTSCCALRSLQKQQEEAELSNMIELHFWPFNMTHIIISDCFFQACHWCSPTSMIQNLKIPPKHQHLIVTMLMPPPPIKMKLLHGAPYQPCFLKRHTAWKDNNLLSRTNYKEHILTYNIKTV